MRSIGVPIVLGATAVPLAAALLVGWTLLLARNIAKATHVAPDVWLLVLGAISFVVIMVVLGLLTVFLAREIIEVRKQDTFIDSVTHELKSPLASLKLCLETLGREELAGEQRERLRQMMLDDVDRLTAFIDDVLQASRLQFGTHGLTLAEVRLDQLIAESVSAVCHRHHLPRESVQIEVDEGLTIQSDPAALEIVLKNLIDNAIKYSPSPPQIRIRAWQEAEKVLIDVIDQGIGIAPKHLKRVFHRFFRIDTEDARRRKGTGIGLFVVSALVRNLSGRVEASSEGEGHGTRIRVVLPTGERLKRKRMRHRKLDDAVRHP